MPKYGEQPLHTVLYARVSTDEQAEEGTSLTSQMDACRQYAAQHGMVRVAEFEEDYTGTTLDRPEFTKIIRMFERGEANAIVVHKFDRLSRNYVDFLVLRDQLEQAGIEVHYCDRGKSLSGINGLMMDAIHGLIAQSERESIIERTRRGKDQRAKEGKMILSTIPLGYAVDEDNNPIIDAETAPIVRLIFQWYAYGPEDGAPLALREIARRLKDMGIYPRRSRGDGDRGWHSSVIFRILANEAYIGSLYYGKTRVINGKKVLQPRSSWITIRTPPLIDESTFHICQRRMAQNRERSRRNQKHSYLLTGYLRCGSCKRAMTAFTNNGYGYYRCSSYVHYYMSGDDCQNRNLVVRCDVVDEAVSEWLLGLIFDEGRLIESLHKMEERALSELEPKRNRINQIHKMVKQYGDKIQRLVQRVGDIDDETVADVLSREIKMIVRDKDLLLAEGQRLESELQTAAYGSEVQQHILEQAAIIRECVPDGTVQNIRSILSMLDVQGYIYIDDKEEKKVWLDVSCGFDFGGSLIELQPPWWTQLNRVVIISETIRLY